MQKLFVAILLCYATHFSYAKTSTNIISLKFESGSHILTPESIIILDSLIKALDFNADFEISLKGHTDNVGDNLFNDVLSAQRVKSVKSFLLKREIDKNIIRSESFGEHKPQNNNSTDLNKSINRRVDLFLTQYSFSSIVELEQALANPNTKIVVDPTITNRIKGSSGIQISLQAQSFLYKDGSIVNEDVELELTEALNLQDFISNNLLTVSNNQMLESGGMLKLSAKTKDGKEINLDPLKPMNIRVPYTQFKSGMEVFSSEDGSNWVTTGNSVQNSESKTLANIFPSEPIKQYSKIKLPTFKRDHASKPKTPKDIGKPKTPKRPDETKYITPLKWYQLPIKDFIQKRQNEHYAQALNRYEKNMVKYRTRKQHYEVFTSRHALKLVAYSKELNTWEEKQRLDSINFSKTVEYQNAVIYKTRMQELVKQNNEFAMELWQRKVDSIIANLEDTDSLSSSIVNSYVMSYNSLSWINIDRFMKLEANELMPPITLKDTDTTGEKVFVIFKDIKSLLAMHKGSNNKYRQSGIPKNQRAALFAYKVVNGRAMVYMENLSVKRDNYTIEYKACKLSELRHLLRELNG